VKQAAKATAAALLVVASMTAQAADDTLTLACQGTTISEKEDKPKPVSIGIVVNFTKMTVHGFFDEHLFRKAQVNITDITETSVSFSGDNEGPDSTTTIIGSMDRVTGHVGALFSTSDTETGDSITSWSYSLNCRPTQRMF
jgi:hypothetical protein